MVWVGFFRPIFLALLTVFLITVTNFAQEKQVTTQEIGATSQDEPAATTDTASLRKTAATQKQPPVTLEETKTRAAKWNLTMDERPKAPVIAEDAAQQKPAAPAAGGEASAEELSKKLSNPVSSLISFPIQPNFDFGMGTGSGWRMTTNVQPVIPVALNKEWNLISRTIVPIIHQGNVVAPGTGQTGLGDIVQSFFISPSKTEPFIWGVGPVVLVPTATNKFLGGKQLGLGPTVVVLKQQKGWTVGALWNHIWRVAGGSGRPKVNADFIQPFLSYSTRDGWSYTLNTESTYDWTGHQWGVPIHFQIAKIVRFGRQPVSFGGALRCWATSPNGGPVGCGLRIVVTGIFPKK